MKIPIRNKCQKKYRPDPEKVITKILNKTPEKYLVGIKEVYLFDSQKPNLTKITSESINTKNNISSILIDMNNKDFSGFPFFAILFLNIHFVDSIVNNYKRMSSRSIEKGIAYDWMYFGIWQPINSLVKAYNLLIRRNRIFSILNKGFNNLLIKIIGQ
jgi:hypothetical protein